MSCLHFQTCVKHMVKTKRQNWSENLEQVCLSAAVLSIVVVGFMREVLAYGLYY